MVVYCAAYVNFTAVLDALPEADSPPDPDDPCGRVKSWKNARGYRRSMAGNAPAACSRARPVGYWRVIPPAEFVYM